MAAPDAIALLKADHRAVEALFEDFKKARGAARKAAIVHQICVDLTVHTMIEEEIFYPACRGKIEDSTLDEAYVEHDGAKLMIAELSDAAPNEAFYDAKVKVLGEYIKHHVKEEEQPGGLFSQAKKGDEDLEQMGEQLKARKEELMAELGRPGAH